MESTRTIVLRLQKDAVLDVRTHFKPTETFQYTHFSSSHPPRVKKGFIKGYPENPIITTLSEAIFEDRKLALQKKTKGK